MNSRTETPEATMKNQAGKENVSDSELRKFAELAEHWWNPEGDFKPLHQLNPVRLGYVRQHTPLDGLQVLDIGCGGGLLSEAMAAAGARVTGIDMSEEALAVARQHAEESGLAVDYRLATAEQLAEEAPESFDLVTCMEMLEHVPDPGAVVEAAGRLTRPGGQLVFSTINRNGRAWLLAIVGAEYLAGILPKGTHQYRQLIRPSELARACRTAGLEVRDISGMSFNPLRSHWSLSRDCSVNYLLAALRSAS